MLARKVSLKDLTELLPKREFAVDDKERIPCRPEKYLTIPAFEIGNDLWCRLKTSTSRKYWRKFEKTIYSILAMNYDKLGNSVRNSLEALKKGHLELKHLRPTLRSIDENLNTLFEASQYLPLGCYTYCHAVDTVFEFDFVTEVQWHKLDETYINETEYLHTFDTQKSSCCFSSPLAYERRSAAFKEDRKDAEEEFHQLQQHMRVYLRGRETQTLEGFFTLEKINCMLTMFVEWACQGPEGSTVVKSPQALNVEANPDAIWVDRVSLRKIVENEKREGLMNMFRILFQKVKVIEPVFTHVCTVYRDAASSGNNDSELHITLFRNIAFGDIEAVFPHTIVKRKPLDNVIFFQSCLFTFYCLYGICSRFSDELEIWKIVPTLCLLFKIIQNLYSLFAKYMNQDKRNKEDVRKFVERKQAAHGMPVVSELVDEAKQQDFKEIILTYWFLWQLGAMEDRELDDTVEKYLKEHLHIKHIDFDHLDGLERLRRLGLVTKTAEGKHCVTKSPRRWLEENSIPKFNDLREVFTSSEIPTAHETLYSQHSSFTSTVTNSPRAVRR
eukprot:TRINITY_DN4000_c1_g1_i1.p1 TRINITY_DN4000_c1_g1~~TRINITY_DN4000_c1_g1_i1.p1  ORF type:complete len:556 (+),score=91.51 TRINITY_DN4000_c1_g1_i1:46-1713(+)